MAARKMIAPVGGTRKVRGSRIATPFTEPNPGNVRQPKVGCFITRYKKMRRVPYVVDLAQDHQENRKIAKVLDPTKYHFAEAGAVPE